MLRGTLSGGYVCSVSAWSVSVPRGYIRRRAQLFLLPDAVLHHQRADGHPVVAVVLDQRRRHRRPRQHRPAERSDADDAVGRLQGRTAARLLRQGDRRLDVDVPRVRVRVADRVRDRQRVVSARRPPFQAVGRTSVRASASQRRRQRHVRSSRVAVRAVADRESSIHAAAAAADGRWT